MNSWFGATLNEMRIEWNLVTAVLSLHYVVLLRADVSDTLALMLQSIQVLEETAIDSAITGTRSFSHVIYLGYIQDVLVHVSLHTG